MYNVVVQKPNMKRYGTSINRDAIACIRGWKALKFIDKVEAPALEKDDPQLVVGTNYYILMCRRLRFWRLLDRPSLDCQDVFAVPATSVPM